MRLPFSDIFEPARKLLPGTDNKNEANTRIQRSGSQKSRGTAARGCKSIAPLAPRSQINGSPHKKRGFDRCRTLAWNQAKGRSN